MKNEHWQQINTKHPKTLNHCIEYFQLRFLHNWREKIKEHRYLFEYFLWIHEIKIDVDHHSFTIQYRGLILSKDGLKRKEESEIEASKSVWAA